MKLNRKGYMLVEIVIASVLAMSIAFYLLNLTYKFKNTNEDIYQSYSYMKDKILITKNIMSDLEKGEAGMSYTKSSKEINFTLIISETSEEKTEEQRKLSIINDSNSTIIKYGKTIDGVFDTNDVSYYEKELDNSLIVKDLVVEPTTFTTETNSLSITIPIESIYDDNDYSIKLFATINTTDGE